MINSKIAIFLLSYLGACFGTDKVASRPDHITQETTMSTFYELRAPDIEGQEIDFSRYRGKKVLIVNTASECGYTPQYEALQQLHEMHGEEVVLLGFPCNQFGGQEPGSEQEIAAFCQKNYGVTFQMFSKVAVKGTEQHPVYRWLTSKDKNGWNEQEPTWNFCKYLVNEKGELVKFYGPAVNPFEPELLDMIVTQ